MKKQFKQILLLFGLMTVFSYNIYSQSTSAGPALVGHNGSSLANDWCGWQTNFPLNFRTNNTLRATVTTGGSLNNANFNAANGTFNGDGISIAKGPSSPLALATLV